MCINEHSQRNPSTMVGAAMVNGIDFPPCFIEEGVRINTECNIRMLDDGWQEDNGSITHQLAHQGVFEGALNPALHVASMLARPEPLDFHLWQEWETALGQRHFQSQLEWRAMIVRTMSELDPEAAEKACTTGIIHRCLACVRARGGHVEHRL